MNLRTMRLAFIAAAGMAAVPAVAASEGGCFVTCKRETGSCQLADRAIAQGLPQLVESCRSQKVTAGPVIAQFRSDGKAGRAQIQGSFSDALAAYKVIDCLAGDSCTSSGGAAKVVLGKGFDPAAAWQVVGDPCGIGLPCGKVGLPADALQVRMKGASAQGRLRVFPARGQGGEQTVDVVAGGAVLPVGLLKRLSIRATIWETLPALRFTLKTARQF